MRAEGGAGEGRGSRSGDSRGGALLRLLAGFAPILAGTALEPRIAPAAPARTLGPLPTITHKVFLDVQIVGFRSGEEKATTEDYSGRMVFGLFGTASPYAVQQFLTYAKSTYGGATPSYADSVFTKIVPGVFVEGGRIKYVKQLTIAGSTQFEFEGSLLPASEGEDQGNDLLHDRRGLLTKSNLQDVRDPTFDITLARASELDGFSTIFGVLLEGFDTLDIIEGVPSLSAGRPAQEVESEEDLLLSNIFSKQKELFLQLGKQLGDERAVDRTGTFLKRVIVTRSGVLPA